MDYLKPELFILIPVLYAVGVFIKNTKAPDWVIPFVLGVVGILLATIWTFSTSVENGWQDVLKSLFTGITQGILNASACVYVNQLLKQGCKCKK